MPGIMMLVVRVALLMGMLWGSGALLRAQPAAAPPAPPAVQPRIVLQSVSEVGLDVAAWSRDGRLLYTASGLARELLVWDARDGIILDRLRLPSAANATAELMRLKSLQLAADGASLTIDGEVIDQRATGMRSPRRYLVDLARRRVVMAKDAPALPPLPAGMTAIDDVMRWVDALAALHGTGSTTPPAQAQAVLPALPASPDGRTQLIRVNPGFNLRGADGKVRAMRVREVMGSIGDAELSPDDRLLAILTLNEVPDPTGTGVTPVEVLDLATGTMLPRVDARGSYDRVKWLDRNRYAIIPEDDEDDPKAGGAAADKPADTRIIQARSGRVLQDVPSLCFMTPLPDGRMLGAGLANCRSKVGRDRGLYLWNGKAWQPLDNVEVERGVEVRRLAVSPRGDRFAVLLRLPDGQLTLTLVPFAATAGDFPQVALEAGTDISLINFSPDGSKLWIAGENSLVEWNGDAPFDAAGNPALRELPLTSTAPQRMASNGTRLMLSGPFEESIQMVDLASGKALRAVSYPGAGAVGYMRSREVIWAASSTEGIRLWDQRTGAVLMTISLLPRSRYVVVAPDARYDTNAGPEADLFRWVISDQPGRLLPPQTLMRDFYEPRMIAKLLDCNRARNCGTVLHKLPSVANLNRELPLVRVMAVRPAGYGQVEVDVTVAETRNPATGLSSGVYGVKLLMNNQEVARNPDDPFAPPTPDLPSWRKANFTPPGDDQGRRYWTFTLPIPSDGQPIEFSAYSFNADRVKSDTARLRWTPPPMAPRPRRAYVLTIGVNDYASRNLKLTFAAADAELIAGRLQSIPGYEVRRATLTSAPNRPLTAEHVTLALRLLAGPEDAGIRKMLAAAGHDGSALAQATPDDAVIISFSGHGFADAAGAFSLLASDAEWGALEPAPKPDNLITADDLTMWLRAIAARDISFIIDACHSGAAVDSPDFKPGPMGDPGLGQLAFDKGIRILAATQAKSLAMENNGLQHGFLSYALGEGLNPDEPKADADRNGQIWLDEWLRYAVRRVPSLADMVASGDTTSLPRGVLLMMPTETAPPRLQEPSLFDFNRRRSPVLLRGQP
ncbi:hypothetical protein CHU93_09785 [Sandarakinorhabdus cyanobacteriorum]|uniref:Peptidase C14 caspase domain-containing protein n=1 Tax=Sandarakinorhabdus cyanobacteriorum TaxID=1981098 RepID=A0A255YH21_9SPHN|nr:caspase family protein [Sandarakinorhabdus cyanobacteriorum]OYQ27760.1 hypothetical protein CHU93_09785 [Sandarakinorhabdus cyanobacteriorum]